MQLSGQMPGNFPHVGLIQFSRPEVTITFDVDQNVARAQRLEQFETAASEQRLSAAVTYHFRGSATSGARPASMIGCPSNSAIATDVAGNQPLLCAAVQTTLEFREIQ